MNLTQPYQLLQLIRSINLDNNRIIQRNVSHVPYNTSLIYPMDPRVSNAGIALYELVLSNKTFVPDYRTRLYGMVPYFNTLSNNRKYTLLYQTFQAVILDTYGLVYLVENDTPNTVSFSMKDIIRLHTNISSLVHTLHGQEFRDAGPIITALNEMDSSVLYVFSTFSNLDYSILANDNLAGKINLIPNSDFSEFSTFYTGATSNLLNINSTTSTLSYLGKTATNISTAPIPVTPGATLSLRANSNKPLSVTAVDVNGNPISYTHDNGSLISNGRIGSTIQTLPGVQLLQGFTVPNTVNYIRVSFTVGPAINLNDDRISELMLTTGNTTGTYLKGAINNDNV